jgi:predicted SprT family Zn-dependent metalloprotease
MQVIISVMLHTHVSSEACPIGPFETQYSGFQFYFTPVGVMKWCNGLNFAKVMEDECTNIVLYLCHCYTGSIMERNLSFDVKIGNNRNECNTCYTDLIVLSFFSMLSLLLMEFLRPD